nr:Trm112 family protein [Paenibacillus xylanexedens]
MRNLKLRLLLKHLPISQSPQCKNTLKWSMILKTEKLHFYDGIQMEKIEEWQVHGNTTIDDIARRYLNREDIKLPPRKRDTSNGDVKNRSSDLA